ncbi:NAD(P)-binding domain-containing protein, partial [Bacillus sp. JJ1521]|uniref:NAD(P)-binding domain-containing protein n=1 Tax=Bacillus sp. JJ1521 TaxID=3122957 RepID=UPI0030000420
MNKKQTIGFIGLGAMGGLMAGHLLEEGMEVHVYDVQESLCLSLKSKGAVIQPNPKAIAEITEIIICMLPNPDIVRQVVLGENGVLYGIKSNSI